MEFLSLRRKRFPPPPKKKKKIPRDKERGEMAIGPCKVRCFVKLHYGTLLGDVLAFSIGLLKVLAGNWMKLRPQTDP